MQIITITENKKRFLDLLLLADEQESMIDKYLERGTMYLLQKDEPVGICVVTDEGNGILEIKNLAVAAKYQRQGYGRQMINFIKEKYRNSFSILQVGTGDSPLTLPFYEGAGFKRSHIIKDFFIRYYDHPIYEDNVQLKDMIYLKLKL